ncbi:hypothetical protein LXN57_29030 [Actinoplanes sp. TRM88002]|uniref:Uncharacterized protein n=1 Tax=Paractinoplanes hotanensis TaxID=2906497 RepID=A0ABT0Y6I6_9ACTN|nr:hypothetical protein [Actinoplanes hotanensis]
MDLTRRCVLGVKLVDGAGLDRGRPLAGVDGCRDRPARQLLIRHRSLPGRVRTEGLAGAFGDEGLSGKGRRSRRAFESGNHITRRVVDELGVHDVVIDRTRGPRNDGLLIDQLEFDQLDLDGLGVEVHALNTEPGRRRVVAAVFRVAFQRPLADTPIVKRVGGVRAPLFAQVLQAGFRHSRSGPPEGSQRLRTGREGLRRGRPRRAAPRGAVSCRVQSRRARLREVAPRCFGMLGIAPRCFGMLGIALRCFGMRRVAPRCFGMLGVVPRRLGMRGDGLRRA